MNLACKDLTVNKIPKPTNNFFKSIESLYVKFVSINLKAFPMQKLSKDFLKDLFHVVVRVDRSEGNIPCFCVVNKKKFK